jgi:hypothetical protein
VAEEVGHGHHPDTLAEHQAARHINVKVGGHPETFG